MKNSDLIEAAYTQPVSLNNLSDDPLISELVKKIIEIGESVTYPAGHIIFERGTVLKTAYIIKNGRTKSFRVTFDGAEFVYWDSRMDHDPIIGFPSVLTGCPVSISIMTASRVELAVIGKTMLLELIMGDPVCAAATVRLLSSKFINTSDNLHSRTEESNKKRFYSMLLKLAMDDEKTNGEASSQVQIAFNQQDVSNYLGVNRTTIFRAFKELQNEGILDYDKGNYIVKDIEMLKKYCLEEIV